MLALSPFALRLVKASFHAHEDGYAGIQQLAHDANLLFYASDEAKEGREAYKARRAARLLQVPPARLMHMWLMAARLRTLPAAVAPVIVGTSIAVTRDVFRPGAFIAALLGAILIQVGTNLSNDYSDARRGADTEDRFGPVRVTAGGLVPPRTVLLWTYLTFGAAALCGVYLVIVAGWQLLVLGILLDPRGRAVHGRPAAVRLRGARRGLRLPLLRHRRRLRLDVRAAAVLALGVLRARRPGRAARDRDPRREQHPRHGHRSARRQAHARGAARASSAHAPSTRLLLIIAFAVLAPIAAIEIADSGSARALWWLLPWLLTLLAVKLVGVVRTRVDGPTLNGALASTAGLQLVFCVLLAAGVLVS